MVKIIGGKELEAVASTSAPNNSVFLDIADNAIKIKDNVGSILQFGIQVPIGVILPWAKTITGVPALPSGFIECDGSTVSDPESPLDGQAVPNLNAGTYRMLRGASTSGGTGGADTHTHTFSATSGTPSANNPNYSFVVTGTTPPAQTHTHDVSGTTAGGSTLPAYYGVVFIIRIK